MDESLSGNILSVNLLICLSLIISAILYFLFCRLKNKKDFDQFEWKIQVLTNENNKTETKFGVCLQDFKTNKIQDISFLQIKRSQVNIMKFLPVWNLANLNALYLNSNRIQTIEQLGWSRFPNLQALDISNNLIFQLKSLRKMQTENLILLSLNNNPICSRMDLSLLNFTNLQYLWLHFHDDIRTFAKLQCAFLLKFHIKGSERIYDGSFIKVLSKKFNNIDIRTKA